MKHIYLSFVFLAIFTASFAQPKMQATIRPGSTPRTIDLYMKSSESFAHRDEAMTFAIAIPATLNSGPTLGSAGVTANSLGPVTGIAGLQPTFLVNNLGTSQREAYVSTQTIDGASYYIYTFIFAGTAPAVHEWKKGIEQQIFSIQFNGCSSNCITEAQKLVSLPNGGNFGIAYWYFQPNTLGDITNYEHPFYQNESSQAPKNGLSTDGSALSTVTLSNAVAFTKEPKKLLNPAKAATAVETASTSDLTAYSAVAEGKTGFQVYPNPISNGVANLQLMNQPAGTYLVRVSTATGQTVTTQQVVHNGGTGNYRIALGNIAKGYYILDVSGATAAKQSIRIVY